MIDFARELSAYRAEHGAPTGEDISTATGLLSPAGGTGEYLSTGRVSGVMAGTSTNPPTNSVIFSFVRAILHLQNPSADPITESHPDVVELQALRTRAYARQSLGTFRERHLRVALDAVADVHHGCFALYALNGATLHIGRSTSESLALRINAALDPNSQVIDRESVAEIELWLLPDLLDDPTAEATVAHLEETLIRRTLHASAPETLRLPDLAVSDESAVPASRIFPLIDSGTLLAIREALRDQAAELAERANGIHARTESLFKHSPGGGQPECGS
ncbi:hypothetical protein GCM10009838_69390 [Catenulispora subtropica]|uniref:Uncharacterized protein n=1 Tax=Catenulispora subtropica TaxID=450798 RepID=A0ABN2SZ46_9ACTN